MYFYLNVNFLFCLALNRTFLIMRLYNKLGDKSEIVMATLMNSFEFHESKIMTKI